MYVIHQNKAVHNWEMEEKWPIILNIFTQKAKIKLAKKKSPGRTVFQMTLQKITALV